MSMPATSCDRRNELTASSYCSRNRELTIASRKLRRPSAAVYQCGRGSDPMIEVGSTTLAEPLNIAFDLSVTDFSRRPVLAALSWPGLSSQVGFTRLATLNDAQLGQARVAVPSTSSRQHKRRGWMRGARARRW